MSPTNIARLTAAWDDGRPGLRAGPVVRRPTSTRSPLPRPPPASRRRPPAGPELPPPAPMSSGTHSRPGGAQARQAAGRRPDRRRPREPVHAAVRAARPAAPHAARPRAALRRRQGARRCAHEDLRGRARRQPEDPAADEAPAAAQEAPGPGLYREALELLDSAEVRLEREEAERRRARRRAEAERRRTARWPPGHVFRDCETCPEMVVLPGSIVALGRYEVTLGEYRAFAAATGRGAGGGCYYSGEADYSWRNLPFPQTDRHPVTCMNWDDAQAYVSWLSRTARAPYRLPTLEELAGAAEASQPDCHRGRTGREGTCPVGAYGPNDLGLSELLGNVVEWTSRCVDGDCSRRWLLGGHWASPPSRLVPAADGHRRTAFRQHLAGFRVARTLQ